MADENVNELLGIEEDQSQSSGIFDPAPVSQIPSDPNAASKGLKKASGICVTFMWISILLAVVGGLMYIANAKDARSGYSWNSDAQVYCAIGSACFVYGIICALSNYVFSKILIGLSVMTQASEKYLTEKK